MADQKATALSELSVPAFEDLTYVVDDPSGTPVSDKLTMARLGGLLNRGIFQARVTTESGVPVSTSDRTSQGTIYLTPIDAGLVRKWDGTRWTLQMLSEISLSLSVTSGKAYDVFYNGTALSLSSAWTDDTTRADALGTQDGVKVLSSDHTKLYVGTIYASGSNVTEDSSAKRYVYNEFNQVPRRINKSDSTSHTYNSNTGRSWNNDATNQLDFILGSAQTIEYALYGDLTPQAVTGAPATYAIVDWTTGTGTVDDAVFGDILSAGRILNGNFATAVFPAGRHYIRAVEVEFGTGPSTFTQYGLRGVVYQ